MASQNICVYTGSNTGAKSDYAAAAKTLAAELVARELNLVYGGAKIGLMGVIADEVLRLGGEVIGVMPAHIAGHGVAHSDLTELHVVDSMHQRKTLMSDLADGFIALPGGGGTMEEIFEVFTWAQLGLHSKPCGLLNICGYYDHLHAFLRHATEEKFMKPAHLEMLLIRDNPHDLLNAFEEYKPKKENKWY